MQPLTCRGAVMKSNIKRSAILAALVTSLFLFQNCGKSVDLDDYTSQSSSEETTASNAPKITGANTPGSVGYFEPANLLVQASGQNLTYQWYKDNTLVVGATNPTLTVAQAIAKDTGTYKVVVSNEFGVIESPALALSVVRKPEQLGPPVIASATPNFDILLSEYGSGKKYPLAVTATGIGLTYEWRVTYLDYSVNPNGESITKMFATTANTVAHEVDYSGVKYPAFGTYTVTVKNYFGEVASRTVTVGLFYDIQFSF
jgi:hypothetical protein